MNKKIMIIVATSFISMILISSITINAAPDESQSSSAGFDRGTILVELYSIGWTPIPAGSASVTVKRLSPLYSSQLIPLIELPSENHTGIFRKMNQIFGLYEISVSSDIYKNRVIQEEFVEGTTIMLLLSRIPPPNDHDGPQEPIIDKNTPSNGVDIAIYAK